MIYVPKPRNKVPRAFLEAARAEMKLAAPVFGRTKGRKPAFKFRAYRNKALVQVLQQLFHGKCAYCEALYAATGYVEVEHYRPKSLYYWLAADWSNLLPSCKRCNNGKLSKFPLADPRKQARKRGEERRETPLLINPCDTVRARRPDVHLTFDVDDGSIRAVAKKGQPSPLAMASIDVYRLARTELSQLRKTWALRVRNQVAFCRLARKSGTAADREMAYQGLKGFLDPGQPFRALTMQILRQSGVTRTR